MRTKSDCAIKTTITLILIEFCSEAGSLQTVVSSGTLNSTNSTPLQTAYVQAHMDDIFAEIEHEINAHKHSPILLLLLLLLLLHYYTTLGFPLTGIFFCGHSRLGLQRSLRKPFGLLQWSRNFSLLIIELNDCPRHVDWSLRVIRACKMTFARCSRRSTVSCRCQRCYGRTPTRCSPGTCRPTSRRCGLGGRRSWRRRGSILRDWRRPSTTHGQRSIE